MKLIDWLRKLGILRFGSQGAVYHNAKERPLSFQQDGVFNWEKDVLQFGNKAGQQGDSNAPPAKGK